MTLLTVRNLIDEEPKANERPDNHTQWTRIVELDLVPHPRLACPAMMRMDYGMTDGPIRMRVRAVVAGYMLPRWSVDPSLDHSLKEQQYRLWLSNPLALYGVEKAKLAPSIAFRRRKQKNDWKDRTRWLRHLKRTTSGSRSFSRAATSLKFKTLSAPAPG